MRLTQQQINAFNTALMPYIKNQTAELRLYGSRIDDQLRGGDIDLLLLVEKEELATHLTKEKHYILSKMKKLIGDQKIDLIIATKTQALEDAFIKLIIPYSKKLFSSSGSAMV